MHISQAFSKGFSPCTCLLVGKCQTQQLKSWWERWGLHFKFCQIIWIVHPIAKQDKNPRLSSPMANSSSFQRGIQGWGLQLPGWRWWLCWLQQSVLWSPAQSPACTRSYNWKTLRILSVEWIWRYFCPIKEREVKAINFEKYFKLHIA